MENLGYEFNNLYQEWGHWARTLYASTTKAMKLSSGNIMLADAHFADVWTSYHLPASIGGPSLGESYVDGLKGGAVSTVNYVKSQFTWEGYKEGVLNAITFGTYGSSQMVNGGIQLAGSIPNFGANDYAYGAGFATEKAVELLLLKRIQSKGITAKWLRASGGKIDGFTISKGSGYGAKSRFDFHKLGRASKASNRMTIPKFLRNKRLLHYHRGRGNNLRRHRPWEKGWNDKSFWDRF